MVRSLLAASILAIGVYAQATEGPKINTPSSLVTCQPSKLTWTGGSPPYFVSVIPGGDPSGAPLKDFGSVDGTETTWIVDVPAGTSVSLKVKDSTGAENYAEKVSVTGSDTSCLAAGGGAAAGGAAPAASADSGSAGSAGAAGSSDTAPAADNSAAAAPAPAAASGSSGSSGAAASGSSGSSGAASAGAAAAAASASASAAPASSASPLKYASSLVLGVAGVVAAALL